MNHVHICGRISVIRTLSSSKLAETSGSKTLHLTYLHTVKSKGVKSGDRGGPVVVTPRPIKATVCRVTRGNPIEHL
jgi:hypothetical protein